MKEKIFRLFFPILRLLLTLDVSTEFLLTFEVLASLILGEIGLLLDLSSLGETGRLFDLSSLTSLTRGDTALTSLTLGDTDLLPALSSLTPIVDTLPTDPPNSSLGAIADTDCALATVAVAVVAVVVFGFSSSSVPVSAERLCSLPFFRSSSRARTSRLSSSVISPLGELEADFRPETGAAD